jgi:hypothetical protein
MDTNVGVAAARSESTVTVFGPGTSVYLRRRIAGLDKIILVRCVGTGANRLVLQWTATDAASSLPRPGEEVTCQSLMQGVLFVANGVIDDVTPGKQPRIHVKVHERCVAVPLRKWPRYAVAGCLRLSETEGSQMYSHSTYETINLSLGGFGVDLPQDAWEGADSVYFILDLLIERNGVADEELPGLTLFGEGMIRRRFKIPERDVQYLGVQFTSVDAEQIQALEFWLAAHNSYLREAK